MKPRRSIEDVAEKTLGVGQSNAPKCGTFAEFIRVYARVLRRDGTPGAFSFKGRKPLEFIVEMTDKIVRNALDGETVEIDGVTFRPHTLRSAEQDIGGGAQWGKTIYELNLMAYLSGIRMLSFGNYLPDEKKVDEIVGQKFRPNVLDLYPWLAEMIKLGKTQNASGKIVDSKWSFMLTIGERKVFGNFRPMNRPATSITIDAAVLDEVDDIKAKNIGYVDARMTGSDLHLTCFIGTQRLAGAGQNARVKAGSFHVRMYPCPGCGSSWNLEEEFPRIIRVAVDGKPRATDPSVTPELGHDRDAHYYCACPSCGAELDRDAGSYVAKNPHRIKDAHFSIRVSQLNISAITLQEIVGAWYAAMQDPSGDALVAFYCDRIAIPNAGAAQPITQAVLDRSRSLGLVSSINPLSIEADGYAMSLTAGPARVAGMDMGPRCWFWCDQLVDDCTSAMVWAELISSGSAPTRVPVLMNALGISCLFMDAGGEPDLTKRLVLSLNGLENYRPPSLPKTELIKSQLGNLGVGLSWDGQRGRWRGIRAAAVLFVAGEAKGIEQTIGFTQDGEIYPLIKCNRGESIQTAVNDFLTPSEGVLEMVGSEKKVLRTLPRARLPQTYIGPGVSQAILDGHLLNLRKEKDTRTGAEDWIDKVENHLGLARVYSRLAQILAGTNRPQKFRSERVERTSRGSRSSHREGAVV